MGNRHGNKKLRLAVRARMATTGESYQKALAALTSQPRPERLERPRYAVDLIPVRYFGTPAAMATFEIAGRYAVVMISRVHLGNPRSPLTGIPSVLH